MGPAVLALVLTATGAAALVPDAPPLSAEDLALIEALDDEPEVALAIVEDARPSALLARTVAETIAGTPLPVAFLRDAFGLAQPVVRGRAGHRLAISVDGVPLRHALSTVDFSDAAATVEPWRLAAIELDRGALILASLPPPESGATTTALRILGRSSDRSGAGHAALAGAVEGAAIWAGGGFTGADAGAANTGHRGSGSGRARLLELEALSVELGFDWEDITAGTSATQRGDRARKLAFIRGLLGGEAAGGTVTGAYHRFDLAAGRAEHLIAIAEAHVAPWTPLTLQASGQVDTGTTDGDGQQLAVEARLGGGLSFEAVQLQLAGGLDYGETTQGAVETDGLSVASEAQLTVLAADPVHFDVRFEQGLRLPSVGDLRQAVGALVAEHTIAVSGGPALVLTQLHLRIDGFYERLTDAIERDGAGRLENVDVVELAGLEARGRVSVVEGLTVAGAMSWTHASQRRFVPGALAKVHVRYDLPVRRAFIEAALSIAMASPNATRSVDPLVRASVHGGVDLFAGLRLDAVVANVFDSPDVLYGSAATEPGIDLRVALSHDWSISGPSSSP